MAAPLQSSTGQEHLCASCEKREGTVYDDEGRLLCPSCAKRKKRRKK
jgi:hypothetical protein